MPVMDEFKEERAAMKNGTPKEKLAYFFDYYKWYVIVGVIAVIFAVTLIHQVATRKDTAFYALMLNVSAYNYMDDSENANAFAEYAGIDTKEYDIQYDTTVQIGTDAGDDYNSSQKLMVYIAAAELDVMVSDADSLAHYAYLGDFYDLRDFLSAEQLEKYADSFYYIDGAVKDEIQAASENGVLDYQPVYGDPHHPEDMADPIPAGLFLGEDCSLLKDYYFRGEDPSVSVLINTKRPEMTSEFIDFLMQ